MWCRGLDVEWSVSRLMMLLLTRSSGWRQTEEQPLRISRRLLQTSNEKLTHTRTYTPPTFHLHRFFAVRLGAPGTKKAQFAAALLSPSRTGFCVLPRSKRIPAGPWDYTLSSNFYTVFCLSSLTHCALKQVKYTQFINSYVKCLTLFLWAVSINLQWHLRRL